MSYKVQLQDVKTPYPWRYLLIFSLLTALVAYGYPLVNFSLNIDGEFRNNLEQTISYGRWGHALLRAYILPEPYIPYFTFLLAISITASAAVLIAWVVGLNKFQATCFCALYITFPQFSYQFEFINQAETFALGQLLSAVSVALFCLSRERLLSTANKVFACVFSVTAYAFVIGIYQTLVLVPPVILLARLVFVSSKNTVSLIDDLKCIFSYFFVAVTAILVYLAIVRTTQYFFQVDGNSYLMGFSQLDGLSFSSYLKALSNNVLEVMTGRQNYGFVTFVLAGLVVAGCLLMSAWRRTLHSAWKAFLALSILALPLSPLLFSQYPLPPRTFVVANLSFAVLVSYGLAFAFSCWREKVALAVVSILSVVHTALITQLFYSDTLARQSDILMANRIMVAITRQYPGFDDAVTPVYFHGGYYRPHPYKLPDSDVFGSSFFAWDGGNNLRLEKFFHYYGISLFRYADKKEIMRVLPLVEALPTWPNPNAIAYRDDVMIVKLGEQRGWLPFDLE